MEPPNIFDRAAAGEFAGAGEPAAPAASRGPRGESLLHWMAFHGAWGSALAWLESGAPWTCDGAGSSPLHWWAMGSRRGWLALGQGLGDDERPRLRALLAPRASELDGFGRDVLGLCCHGLNSSEVEEAVREFPEAAQAGACLGPGLRMGLADALIACMVYCEPGLGEAMAMAGAAPPSLAMPEALGAGGVWDQALWTKALGACAGPERRAAAEAAELRSGAGQAAQGPGAARL